MTNKLHPNNKHNSGYNIDTLCQSYPELSSFVFENQYKTKTIDFGNPKAVKALNTALLFKYYNVRFWEFPDENLCPPIPGRVDYLHYVNDVLHDSEISKDVKVLDIGTGASCIYPILGHAVYNWKFAGSDIDEVSLRYAQEIINKNNLNEHISLRFQKESRYILKGLLTETDRFSVAICNPPFYKSEQEAINATTRKLKGLGQTSDRLTRNFAGKHNELWCRGGELSFLKNYTYESSLFKEQCLWYSSLVSKKDHIRPIKVALKKLNATSIKVINMGTSNKQSRIIAWSFY
ncbi:23S rRNA (adenine(1618)-N(6))-methyltransferase RlmF [Seonamhaeicola marinus]|uniref:Ribosomal RNA large subunit methyltransferase F n=1 Tax=Seonamhaeicola marinus TaxID=1912246 RepID=A0A5D0HJU3_9FLAO|nr:23S rRNA (adenine(1618)-N(6))-methyltransferase RlmF [Seonamhaeicola marinus]TYA71591.1 23S rRNA (adenine(1618)-N(6))-methyltransferase RlmF [Seonamhaeicola marinus]